jgi:4-amino-4-deoxy-L-arabinose transferase-like glycosyltransferase
VALVFILVVRRRAPRADGPRAGAVLWGLWLVVLGVVFTVSTTMNSYYASALAPAVAALLGIGGALAWERRRSPRVVLGTAAVVTATVAYAAWLLPSSGTGLPSWLEPVVIALGVLATAVLLAVALGRAGARLPVAGAGLAAATLLVVPVVATASVVTESLGPFDTPFQPAFVTAGTHTIFAPASAPAGLAAIERVRRGAPWLMAAQTSAVASPFIYATGEEVLPLGGYTGVTPSPTAAEVHSYVTGARFHLALIATPDSTPGAAYVVAHCLHVNQQQAAPGPAPKLKIYYCLAGPGPGS